MAEQEKRKGGGSKLARSETVTVRLDPQLRFTAELAASSERRTLSGFIEWAIERAVHSVNVLPEFDGEAMIWHTAADIAKVVWDVDEADRFVKLASAYPQLLTVREQVLWKLIVETDEFWKRSAKRTHSRRNPEALEQFEFKRLREKWDELINKIDSAPKAQAGIAL